MRKFVQIILLWFLFAFPVFCSGQFTVTFYADDVPGSGDSAIFLAGSFNNWAPGDSNYILQKASGKLKLTISLDPGNYEYKVTRGSWQTSETDSIGKPLDNRQLKVVSDTAVVLKIDGWQNTAEADFVSHTASANVHILDTAFYMPQLNRYRRIWVYLPVGYGKSRKKYPVLYMHDGQNVFDEATSFSGEWGVDEYLDSIKAQVIVIAVDNGGKYRMTEYNPWEFANFGAGEGDQYVDFIVKTLKPYVDKHYRTQKGKKGTSIAGSSMGGLISLYAVLKYPKVFGSAGIFSPAFWTASGIDQAVIAAAAKAKSKLFFYAGEKEGESMVPDMLRIEKEFKKRSKSAIRTITDAEAKHNEAAWRKWFPKFFQWVK